MLTTLLALVASLPQMSTDSIMLQAAVRQPTYATDGRLAFEMNGDLWLLMPPAETSESGDGVFRPAVPITSGPAWDRDPVWTADATAIVFSSDRNGSFDLWSVSVGPDGNAGDPMPLTNDVAYEVEPALGLDGTVVFVRGRGSAADLWVRTPAGAVRQLTSERGAEVAPTVAPDGRRVAYVSIQEGRRQLRMRWLVGDSGRAVLRGVAVEDPAWSPSGDVIAYTTRSGTRGVWLTPVDGGYTNLVSTTPATPAWSADATMLALAELPRAGPGYNGDPDRLVDREVGDILPQGGRLWLAPAPVAPDAGRSDVRVAARMDRTAYNAEAFERIWTRISGLYASAGSEDAWQALRAKYRPRALTASSDTALEGVIHRMLRERPPARREASGRAGISSAHPLATAAGIEILERGGNVIDATVAVSFALGVVEPDASGIGGYGEMVVSLAGMDEPVVIEFLTRVPEAATLGNAAILENGRLPTDGPVLANVPGTVAGMWLAWQEYGSGAVDWSELLAPAIRLAREGFVLDDAFPTTLAKERERYLKYESSQRLFFPNGNALAPGDTLRNPDLAWTLAEIAEGGAGAFYEGTVAERMVADLRGRGNAMTLADLSRYFAVKRAPVIGTYRGHTIYGAAPASSGGVSLVSKLHLLEHFSEPALYRDDAATAHAMIEAWKLAPSTAGRVADPSLWPVDLQPFTDSAAARLRWQRCFDRERATGPNDLERGESGPVCADEETTSAFETDQDGCDDVVDIGAPESDCRAAGTTSFSVADADGNMVAVTQTLGTWGGNFYVSPGLGFLYNDKLRSYRTRPDAYGARLPYARHGTSIAPTLVFRGTGGDKRPMLAVGAAGNAWITSAVYQVITGVIDGGLGPQRALELPRFLVGVRRSGSAVREIVVQIEDGFDPEVMRQLRAIGHELQPISLRGELRMGYGAAVLIDAGRVRAGADPRRSGAAGAVR